MTDPLHEANRARWDAAAESYYRRTRGRVGRGPLAYDAEADVFGASPARLPQYEFHWTVSEFLRAVRDAGLGVVEVDEFGSGRESGV